MNMEDSSTLATALARCTWRGALRHLLTQATLGQAPLDPARLEWTSAVAYAFADATQTELLDEATQPFGSSRRPTSYHSKAHSWLVCSVPEAEIALHWDDEDETDDHMDPLAFVLPLCCWQQEVTLADNRERGSMRRFDVSALDRSDSGSVWDPQAYVRGHRSGTIRYLQSLGPKTTPTKTTTGSEVESVSQCLSDETEAFMDASERAEASAWWSAVFERITAWVPSSSSSSSSSSLLWECPSPLCSMPLHPERDLHLPGVLEAVNLEEEHLQALERERARQSMAQETTNSNAYVEGDADELGGLAFTGRVMESKRQPGFSLTQVFQPTQGDEILFGVRLEELETEEEEPVAQGPLDAVYADSSAAAVTARPVETPLLTERLDAGLGDVERTLERLVLSSERIPSDAFASRTKQTPRSVFAIMDESDPVDFEQKIPHPALEFPFELDRFQKQAILHVERGECVFVAAHTSAGKTAVAEYAIALSRAHATKAIYTSPIKTLSNQKFRDFCVRFGAASVGLITGDVSIQPTASCLIMTTEILRSMLYRGADLIRDVEWVIFDEVHYVNDEERGVVWEEVIILLPEHVNLMMLSATVPNAREFAEWVGRCKQRTVYVISTSYRPVPLQHYLFAKNDLILVKNARGEFLRQGYKAAQDAEREALTKRGVKGRAAAAATVNRPAWSTLVHFLRKRDLMPAVVFCFSRKRCEEAADSLGSMDLLQGSASDGNRIHVLMESALSRLSDADRRVPQIGRVRDLLRRGIGVHHAGLLPIVKEMTEILFQRGLVRVLFATETFAMGVNMPARTVVFSGIRKHDGRQFRLLTPGEYTQMSGRAGRRGLDAYGLVILFFPPGELPSELDLKRTMTGVPPRLSSQFRLSYNMILNLIRTEHVQVEEVIRRSFTEAESFAAQRRIRRLLDRGRQSLERLDAELASFGDLFAQYYQWVRKVVAFATSIHETLLSVGPSGYARTSAVPGRLLLLRRSDGGVALGVILGSATEKRYRVSATSLLDEIRRLVVPVLALIGGPALAETVFETTEAETEASASSPVTVFTETVRLTYQHRLHGIEYCLGDAAPSEILTIYQNTIELGKELPALERALFPVRGPPNEDLVASLLESLRSMAEVLDTQLRQEETPESTVLVPMNPRVHCGLADLALEATWLEKERILHNHILRSACLMDTYHRRLLAKAFALAERRYNLEQKLEYLSFASSYRSLQLLPDYVQRLAVLQRLGYVERAGGVTETDWEHDTFENGERAPSSGLMVTLKGRAACEVGTCDSLLLVETILEGTLSELNPSGIAALLSCLVFQEKLDPTEYMLPEEAARIQLDQFALDRIAMETLATALSKLRRIALALGTAQAECGLPVSPSEYQSMTVNPGLLLPALLWAQGAPFKDVCQWTPVQEGSIVRTIVRLCELLRETADVARVIGDSRLLTLVDLAIRSIKRDIIFAASLYVT